MRGYNQTMNVLTDPHAPQKTSVVSLREELLGSVQPLRHRPTADDADATTSPTTDPSMAPTAAELLASSASLRRLCESYHGTYRRLEDSNRRQRLGIAALVGGVGIGAVGLFRAGSLDSATVSALVLTVALASAAGLGALAFLWVRATQKLRAAQGERVLRALQFNCTLAPARLDAFRRFADPTTAFFDCYGVWRAEYAGPDSKLIALLAELRGQRRR